MTISLMPSAPLVAIVGATGAQGGSVIRSLVASDKPYRLRGLTRDPAKPAAQELAKLGVEMVAIDPNPTPENKVRVNQAFEGAAYAFVSVECCPSASVGSQLIAIMLQCRR